jgi:hypothetical protein
MEINRSLPLGASSRGRAGRRPLRGEAMRRT